MKRRYISTTIVTILCLFAMIPMTSAHVFTSCCASIWDGFWVSCDGAQYVGIKGGWLWAEYNDNSLDDFEGKHSLEYEWILPSHEYTYHITSYYSTFISPEVDNADGPSDPGTNEYGIAERKPEDWVIGKTYYTSFLLDGSLPEDISLSLEIELNEWRWIIWPFWGYHDPEAGCQLRNVPRFGYAYWINADRTLTLYEHHTMDYRGSSHDIRDYSDFITVDLISVEEMMYLQEIYNLNILGFEMFNLGTGETAGVFLWHGESIRQGLEWLEELGVKDPSGFRVFAIKLSERANPNAFRNRGIILTVGRVHPNDDEWTNL